MCSVKSSPHEGAILVVDDDPDQRWLVENYLSEKGFSVHTVEDGEAMWKKMDSHTYDVVIMDVGLPGDDGFQLTKVLAESHDVGIIMVTAANDLVDRVLGLEMGADDYLAKPFELRELFARLKSIIRRQMKQSSQSVSAGDEDLYHFEGFTLDVKQFLVTHNGEPCFMEPKSLDLLIFLVKNRDRVISKDEIMSSVWPGRVVADSTLSTLVKQLRRSLDDNGKDQRLIRTVHGRGFQFIGEIGDA
ncbi:MAG: response regulator transcription factor [Acidiferrobacterales bacterium]|nr:response regulator transcription factor [Acidiferrobacterales bacterium]